MYRDVQRSGWWVDFGLMEYQQARAFQLDLVRHSIAHRFTDLLLLGEHPSVITCGRGTQVENLRGNPLPKAGTQAGGAAQERGPRIVEVERGGDVTYHGPGQLIGYPIIDLDRAANPVARRDLHAYLRALEEVLIGALADFGIHAGPNPGWTGVWVGEPRTGAARPSTFRPVRKIASIGIAVKRWITYHGFALNVHTNLSYFEAINPCGLPAATMTSLSRELGENVGTQALYEPLLQQFRRVFGIDFKPVPVKNAPAFLNRL